MKKTTTGSISNDNPLVGELQQLIFQGSLMPAGTEPHRLAQQLSSLPSLPDRFNAEFIASGWIFVEFACSHEAAGQALSMKARGAPAEEIDTYLSERLLAIQPIRWQSLKALGGGMVDPSYPIRAEIVARALDAHDAGDYLVSVPLILMLVDGFGVSVTGTKSMFSDLEDIDGLFLCVESMAGHPSALRPLLEQLRRGQRGYSEKLLNMPLRNGILHGTRLNYANKVVAAKALNLLGAVVEWARDTAPEAADQESRKAWNGRFLLANLNRLRPETPQAALNLFSSALTSRRTSDVVALLDYHPVYTNLAEKMREWRELDELEINIERISEWEVFGDDRPGQTARCAAKLTIKHTDGTVQGSDTTIYASRPIELVDSNLPGVWQIGLSVLGTIRGRLQEK
jgi:hypothetical protein